MSSCRPHRPACRASAVLALWLAMLLGGVQVPAAAKAPEDPATLPAGRALRRIEAACVATAGTLAAERCACVARTLRTVALPEDQVRLLVVVAEQTLPDADPAALTSFLSRFPEAQWPGMMEQATDALGQALSSCAPAAPAPTG